MVLFRFHRPVFQVLPASIPPVLLVLFWFHLPVFPVLPTSILPVLLHGVIPVSSTSISGIACQYSTSITGIISVLHSSIAVVLTLINEYYWYSLPVLHQYCWSQHLRTYSVSQYTEFNSSLHVHRGLYRIFPTGGEIGLRETTQSVALYSHILMFSVHVQLYKISGGEIYQGGYLEVPPLYKPWYTYHIIVESKLLILCTNMYIPQYVYKALIIFLSVHS